MLNCVYSKKIRGTAIGSSNTYEIHCNKVDYKIIYCNRRGGFASNATTMQISHSQLKDLVDSKTYKEILSMIESFTDKLKLNQSLTSASASQVIKI